MPFPALDAAGVDKLIARARLPESDKIIARAYLNNEKIVDIAALREISMDRSAVAKRLRGQIVPRLDIAILGARRYG